MSVKDFDYELDKAHRLPMKASRQKNHQQSSTDFGLISLGASFLKKKRKFTIKPTVYKINSHVSLTKYRSDLLQEANVQ